MKYIKKKYMNIFGKILSIIGLAYVFYLLSIEFTFTEYLHKLFGFKYLIIFFILFNIISYLLGVVVWHLLLKHYSKLDIRYSISFYFYAKTDIAKYLPGNIFHIVGRQLLAKKLKIEQGNMFNITVFSSYLITFSSFVLISILSLKLSVVPEILKLSFPLILTLFFILTFNIYPSIGKKIKIAMILVFILGFLFQSLIVILLISKQLPNVETNLLIEIVIIYIASAIIGFITPGASGGIGVRESAFITLLSITSINISNEIAIFSIILIRILNIVTDVLLNICTYFQKDKFL